MCQAVKGSFLNACNLSISAFNSRAAANIWSGNPVEGERDSGGKTNSFARLPEWCSAWSGMFSTGEPKRGEAALDNISALKLHA